MAKNKDAAYEAFLADLKAINPAIEEIIKDDKVSAKLREGVLARAEFSSNMDQLEADKKLFGQEVNEARTKIAGWQKWYGDTSQQFAGTADELQRYRDAYGELDADGKRKVAQQVGMSAADFEKRLGEELQQREVGYLKFTDVLTDIKMEHRDRFKEKLDTNALYKIAGEKNIPIDVAYGVYIADRVEDLNKASMKEELQKAREEGAREALAKHNLPNISSNSEMVHVIDVKDAPQGSNARVAAAINGFLNRT